MTFMAFDFTHAFLDYSRAKLIDESWRRMRVTVESLTDDQIWWRPNEASNSIGNLLLHLNGNVRQWLVTSFNQHIDARQRPAEFADATTFQCALCSSGLAPRSTKPPSPSAALPPPCCRRPCASSWA
jgi:hypothetical protein